MKHTTSQVFSISFFSIYLVFVALPSFANTQNPLSFTFTPSTGVISGTVSEYLYEEDKTLQSQLDWQQYAVPFIKMEGQFELSNVFLNLSALSAIPFKCGIMEDYDWIADDDGRDGSSDTLSYYSKHDLYLDKRFDLSARGGYTFYFNRFYIAPGLGLTYRSQKWSGVDGYAQHATDYVWTENTTKVDYSGTVISYEQSLFLPYISVNKGFFISPKVKLTTQGLFYPYMFITAYDNHYTGSDQYVDVMYGGNGINVACSLAYKKIAFTISYEWLAMFYGETYTGGTIGSTDRDFVQNTDFSSGTSSSLLTISVEYTF